MPKKLSVQARKNSAGIVIPSGQEIFDGLMRKIEPELVTSNLPKLDAPYAKETPAQHKKRYARYSKAFMQYKKEFKAWSAKLQKAVAAYKKALFKAAEKHALGDEGNVLADLEAKMQSL